MHSLSITTAFAALALVTRGAGLLNVIVAQPPAPSSPSTSESPVGCGASRAASTPIPFERVNLGPASGDQGGDDKLLGPRLLAVVTDSTSWPAVWRAAVDSVAVPPVTFGKSVLVLVATKTYGFGRVTLRIVAIRQCRENGIIVVSTMETAPRTTAIAIQSRGIDVVRVPGRDLATNHVVFEEHYKRLPY